MTPENRAIIFLAALAALFIVYQLSLGAIKCRYCGRVNGHEDHCPFNGTGMTGGLK